MWRQRPLHVAFTAQEPVAYQPQGLIGLKSASMPQHEMLADVGESGQNASRQAGWLHRRMGAKSVVACF
jgi:hypothetical protein